MKLKLLAIYLYKVAVFAMQSKETRKFFDTKSKIAVIYSLVGYQQEDLLECIQDLNFLTLFPIDTLRKKQIFIIESNRPGTYIHNNIIVEKTEHPILLLFLRVINKKNIFSIIYKFLLFIIKAKFKKSKILNKSITETLNHFADLDIFGTISSTTMYPREFYPPKSERKYTTHIIHYSENSIPIKMEEIKGKNIENPIVNSNSLGDIHWVWTSDYANYLKKINNSIDFRAVGSITFKMPRPIAAGSKRNKIIVFDIAPQKQFENISFYNFKLAEKFLRDIITVRNKFSELKQIEIYLKPKRILNSEVHSEIYLDLIKNLVSTHEINLLDFNTNPYTIIEESLLSISIPFTSTAVIGQEVGTNSIYYYPFSSKLYNPLNRPNIPVIYGRVELEKFMINNII